MILACDSGRLFIAIIPKRAQSSSLVLSTTKSREVLLLCRSGLVCVVPGYLRLLDIHLLKQVATPHLCFTPYATALLMAFRCDRPLRLRLH